MTIQKIGHSCLLLEENGKRLLIDPGTWAFAPIGAMQPEDIGPVDVVLFTHEHADHFSVDVLKRIAAMHMPRIISHESIQKLLAKEGIQCEVLLPEQEMTVEEFRIRGIKADHGDLIVPKPENMGFLVNNAVFVSGDSLTFEAVSCEVFAMPLGGPWMRLKDAVEKTKALKPKVVVPVHDAFIKDFFLVRLYETVTRVLKEEGIECLLLTPGEKFTV